MNENINLCEILKDCPKGTKLWHSVHGEVTFICVYKDVTLKIKLKICVGGNCYLQKDGHIKEGVGDCLLWPSKEQRDWSKWKCQKPKFDPKTLQPYDKVLGGGINSIWKADFFSHEHIPHEGSYKVFPYKCTGNMYEYCIPYNDDTKHLVGTEEEAPEYYRYWED